ncbi:hypothetical protein GSI_13758 [Ganoderma sinense ZZ0214-1]|uniref:SGNH hydrolase-type esterase domain-containing protein n=1 Tax=Ganoderma sinense ZZ0214-1 TaxID=1077348 RepID=A0A2G8RR73_9APHY|nr:hypothetical protein GSI_13758 [Ganoderma sinense ZZ0214-1]
MPNWVGYLITEYSPDNRFLVYDYAVGGDSVLGVRTQVQVNFLPRVGEKPSWAPWNAEDTLFITWIGINDCARLEIPAVPNAVEELFVEQEALYQAGARNFLFIDVPPIHRSPGGVSFSRLHPDFRRIYEVWNSTLRERIVQFTAVHPEITALLFSSWDTFSRVLDDPVSHGFGPEHVSRSRGEIWVDNLHPSSKMHDWIAHDIAQFLKAQSAYPPLTTEAEEQAVSWFDSREHRFGKPDEGMASEH